MKILGTVILWYPWGASARTSCGHQILWMLKSLLSNGTAPAQNLHILQVTFDYLQCLTVNAAYMAVMLHWLGIMKSLHMLSADTILFFPSIYDLQLVESTSTEPTDKEANCIWFAIIETLPHSCFLLLERKKSANLYHQCGRKKLQGFNFLLSI